MNIIYEKFRINTDKAILGTSRFFYDITKGLVGKSRFTKTVDVKNFPDDKFYDLLQEKIKNSTFVKKEAEVFADTEGTY